MLIENRNLQIAILVFTEMFRRGNLTRMPEPPLDSCGFHDAGIEQDSMIGAYHFNALATHFLAPKNGTVLDLGCGSGRALAHLARRRPDLRIIGIDLDPKMVELGNRMLREEHLSDRVTVRAGDMTRFADSIDEDIHVVRSVFALHHLETESQLHQCLAQVEMIRKRFGSAIWIFDHARPGHRSTAEKVPEIFTPSASSEFKNSSRDSMIASWSFAELGEAMQTALGRSRSVLARLFPLYQIHWDYGLNIQAIGEWKDLPISQDAQKDARGLNFLFRNSLPSAKKRGPEKDRSAYPAQRWLNRRQAEIY